MINRIENEDLEFNDFLDGITETELSRHPDVETDGDKIANIWGILGITDEDAFSKIIGIEREEIPQVFANGLENENIRRRLNRVFAYASILERKTPDLSERKRLLERPHPFLDNLSPIQSLRRGQTDKVLFFAEGQE